MRKIMSNNLSNFVSNNSPKSVKKCKLTGGGVNLNSNKNPSNILYKNIKECNIKLIIIIGLLFIMLSGFVSYAIFSDNVESTNLIVFKTNKKYETQEFIPKNTCEEYTAPYTGYYLVEAWGAQGGGTNGGLGAYTSGITKLIKGETLYVCVGGTGGATANVTNVGGFNGGGYSGNYSGTNSYGGGGSTDIRLVSGTWNNDEGLNSRIMVAAGGAGTTSSVTITGGAGGGLIGINGTSSNSNYNTNTYLPTGGTQTSGGYGYVNTDNDRKGHFGYAMQENPIGWGGGGGSGYYGGGTGHGTTGAGGSSFISGYAGVNAITSSTDRTHTNDTLHYSNKYFINAKMEAGTNSGNGKAKITYVSSLKPERVNTSLNNVRYIKDCISANSDNTGNHTVELQAIYNGVNIAKGKVPTESHGYLEENSTTFTYLNATDGRIENIDGYSGFAYSSSSEEKEFCLVVDLGEEYDLDEVAVWHYWEAIGRTYYNNYTYVSNDNTTWTKVIDRQEPETSEGKRVNAYETLSLKIIQKDNGVLTCTNSATGITSTTLLSVTKGDSITCNATTNYGYGISSIKIGNDSITSGTSFTYTYDLSSTIVPTYKDVSVTLSIVQNTGGTLTCKNNKTGLSSTSSLKVVKGDSITCTASPNSSYAVASLKIDSTSITSGTAFTYSSGTTVTPTYGQVSKTFSYTGSCVSYTIPYTGYYQLEAYGASGGSTSSTSGGKGGYTKGITNFTKGEVIYVCVGGAGGVTSSTVKSTVAGGFNGGGTGINGETNALVVGAGGGATDIRLSSGSWDDTTGLNSRIMVAAGAGGAHYFSGNYYGSGGNGGGLIGGEGLGYASGNTTAESGGSQTSVSFGKSASYTNYERPGGGGGYYGGNVGFANGSGGSSFISGYAGVNAITSSTDRTHTNNTLHYSNKYFINGSMKSGVRSGNGYATLKLISVSKPTRKNTALNNVRYIKDCVNGNSYDNTNRWNEIQAIYNGTNIAKGKAAVMTDGGSLALSTYVTDGDIGKAGGTDGYSSSTCILIDLGSTYNLDEIAVWHNWKDNLNDNKDNYTYVSSNNSTWIKVIDKQEVSTSEGKRVNAYDAASITIKQSTGGTITCKNNSTGQSSTSSLTVSNGDSVTCSVSTNTYYSLTTLKLDSTTITNGKAFTYSSGTAVSATYYCSDTTGPTLSISNSNSGWTFGPVYMTYTATDTSGVSDIYYRYGSDSSSTKRRDWDSSSGSGTTSYTVTGTWSAARNETVYVTAVDKIGNTTTKTTTVRIKSCNCMYRSSTYKSVPSWYHSVCGEYHSTAYLHLCYCTDGSIYNCTSSGWSDAGGAGCYVHTGYNAYTGLDYSWSNYSGSYW